MTDDLGRVWKLHEEGYRYLVSREEYRDVFMLRRKKLTYRAIGDIYQVSYTRARQIFFKYMRIRRVRVLRYLEIRKSRGAQ
jgi:DNA-directed RNA polymerase sigma subunit (sigma70/sigma32)